MINAYLVKKCYITNSSVSDSDYEHGLTLFDAFECQRFSDYLEIYQNVDVIMLAEIFLSFGRTSIQSYDLDPVHFITSTQLTWNASLKISEVELQLLGDVNEHEMRCLLEDEDMR
ncbi:uncharacterized protein TNCV_847331 [Trichonephila clavipes]|nr:uncharacterized protein TNCV_847331 [Trichonephila clavipes]